MLADPGQLEQIIVNLAVNARDAMPKGGTLTIETTDVPARRGSPRLVAAAPGSYVALDRPRHRTRNGRSDARAHLRALLHHQGWDGHGARAGDGYGIVKQSGGQIPVESELGQGTHVQDLLAAGRAGRPPSRRGAAAASLGGRETVLLVEDEPRVRAVLKKVLVGAGYDVLEAANADDASLVTTGSAGPSTRWSPTS